MAKVDSLKIQVNEEIIELVGKDKEAFIAQREADRKESETRQAEIVKQIELKKSAYTKLGLTEEEINAIL